jgi:hypothetical protein
MTRSRRGRFALIARGLLLLAAVLLLPLAAMLPAPRESAAQVAQDSLWAVSNGSTTDLAVCASPSSPSSLSGCFSSATSSWPGSYNQAVATDGVNVYFVGEYDGGLSCPIADLGANCTRIMAGPWPPQNCGTAGCQPLVLAAANGYLWIGQGNGKIYRCPSNIPYVEQTTAPSQCVLLDDAGDRSVYSLLLANGTLYAGLSEYGSEQKKQGLLWSCSPNIVNSCSTLDSYGNTSAESLAAGGGYLWAGLGNGIVWRCDLNAANACATWENAGANWATSLSYDGQGTLYAAIDGNEYAGTSGVIWSCPTAYANGCSNLISNVNGVSVAAGAGGVFSSTTSNGLHYGTSSFTAANVTIWKNSQLLYLPADGPDGVGGVSVKMTAKSLGKKLDKRCDNPGKTPKATVTVTGPNGFERTLKTGICRVLNGGFAKETLDLLDPGEYTVRATAGKRSGQETFTIERDRTKQVTVKLRCPAHG